MSAPRTITEEGLRNLWRVRHDAMRSFRRSGAITPSERNGNAIVYQHSAVEALHQQQCTSQETFTPLAELLDTVEAGEHAFLTSKEVIHHSGYAHEKVVRDAAKGNLTAIRIGSTWRFPATMFFWELAKLKMGNVIDAQTVAQIIGMDVTAVWRASVGDQAVFERALYADDRRMVGITEASLIAYLDSRLSGITPKEWIARRLQKGDEPLLSRKDVSQTCHVHLRVVERLITQRAIPCLFSVNTSRPIARFPQGAVEEWQASEHLPVPTEKIAALLGLPHDRAAELVAQNNFCNRHKTRDTSCPNLKCVMHYLQRHRTHKSFAAMDWRMWCLQDKHRLVLLSNVSAQQIPLVDLEEAILTGALRGIRFHDGSDTVALEQDIFAIARQSRARKRDLSAQARLWR